MLEEGRPLMDPDVSRAGRRGPDGGRRDRRGLRGALREGWRALRVPGRAGPNRPLPTWDPPCSSRPIPRTTYDATRPARRTRRGAEHALVREVKRVIELTAAPRRRGVDRARRGRRTVARTRERRRTFERAAEPPRQGGAASAVVTTARCLERSGISGAATRSPPAAVATRQGDVTHGWATYSPAYEGPAGACTAASSRRRSTTCSGPPRRRRGAPATRARLIVKMLLPTPLGEAIDYEAAVDRVEGRKIWVRGTASCEGLLLAEAETCSSRRRAARPR